MGIGFYETSVLYIDRIVDTDYFMNLPNDIQQHTDLHYSSVKTERGLNLKPIFHFALSRNHFVPEIDIVVSHRNRHTCLYMTGRPVKLHRLFLILWFSLLLLFQLFIILFAGYDIPLNVIIMPFFMGVFTYLLFKFAIKLTYKRVVNVIGNLT